jgi:hypothetical protein
MNNNINWSKDTAVERKGVFGNLIFSIVLMCVLGTLGIVVELMFVLDEIIRVVLWSMLALFYSIAMPLILLPRLIITNRWIGVQDVEREVIVEKPVEVIRVVEKPIVKYKEKPRKKLNIPKYNFLGSTETNTYHKHSCRFSKLIKRNHKVSNNSESYFKRRGFVPCKMCIDKKK